MKRILFLIGLTLSFQSVFAENIAKTIAGKSFENYGGDGVTHINAFDENCKNVTSYEDGKKMGVYPITCGETVVFKMGSKTITYSNGWTGLSKEVDLGFKTVSFSPKEVQTP